MRILKQFSDGTKLCFDEGRIDCYRVSFYKNGRCLTAPKDIWHFEELLQLGNNEMAMEKVYILGRQMPLGRIRSYKSNNGEISFDMLEIPGENEKEKKLFSALAAMMIAEEKKILENGGGSKIGALLKVIGCYQVLVLGWPPIKAANWSKKRGASEIKMWAKKLGILKKLEAIQQLEFWG